MEIASSHPVLEPHFRPLGMSIQGPVFHSFCSEESKVRARVDVS